MKKSIILSFIIFFSLTLFSQTKNIDKKANEMLLYYRLFKASVESDHFKTNFFCCRNDILKTNPSKIKILINDTTLVYFNNQDTGYFKEYIHIFKSAYKENMIGTIVIKEGSRFGFLFKKESEIFRKHPEIFLIDTNIIRIYDQTGLLNDSCSIEICNKKLEITHDSLNNVFDPNSSRAGGLLSYRLIILYRIDKEKNNYKLYFYQPGPNTTVGMTYKVRKNKIKLIRKNVGNF